MLDQAGAGDEGVVSPAPCAAILGFEKRLLQLGLAKVTRRSDKVARVRPLLV